MSTPVITARPTTKLKAIAVLLLAKDISAVPVVDETQQLLGIVTDADLVPLQSVQDPRRHALPAEPTLPPIARCAGDVMATDVVTASEDEDVTSIARLMLERGLKQIPVVSGGTVVGIIARRDMLKVLARADASIETELQASLDDERQLIGQFHAQVVDGVVTLVGPKDERLRRLAGILARGVPGVLAVRFSDPR